MNKTGFIAIVFTGMLLSGCGGGGSSSTSHALDGQWTRGCGYDSSDGTSGTEELNIDGGDVSIDITYYNTGDCSGSDAGTIKLKGDIDYVGEHNTSVCVAEKINVEYDELYINGQKQSTQVFTKFLSDSGLANPSYDISCVYRGKLYSGSGANGNDGSSANKRPVTLDLSDGLDRF